MDTTRQTPPESAEPRTPGACVLMVAYHPDPGKVGIRLAIADGTPLAVGREPGLFDDPTMSRRHARIEVGTGGRLVVEDVGSRNGTFVNGEPVTRQPLRHGDVLGIGDVLLLVVQEPAPAVPAAEDIARSARRGAPILLVGETGVGKSRLARLVHDASGRGPLVPLPCGTLPPDRIAEELFGLDATAYPPGRPGLVERADRGTLLLDDVDDAPPGLAAALLAFLENGEARRLGAAVPTQVDVRVIATAREPGRLRAELLARLSGFVVHVPPLRDRPADLPLLTRDLLAAHGRWARRALVQALVRHGFPHNVRELGMLLDRAVADAGDERLVGLSPGVAGALGLADVGSPGALAIASDGTWFRPPGATRVSLANRENLVRLLAALLDAHQGDKGRPLSTEALFAAGWPGERIQGQAAAGRVYVALTSLRNLGLRQYLRRSQGGYMLDPAAKIEGICATPVEAV